MASKVCLLIFVLFLNSVHSESILERSYEYVMNLGKNLAPSFMSILDCFGEEDAWFCAREKAGKILDGWDKEVEKQRMIWADAADAEVASTGRSFEELPSKVGRDIESSLTGVSDLIQRGMERALARKKHDDGGGVDLTISASSDKKKKMKKKKKQKPPKIHLLQPMMMMPQKTEDKGRRVQSWVLGNLSHGANSRNGREILFTPGEHGRGILSDVWNVGEKALDAVAEHVIDKENSENGLVDRSSIEEQRGKKKKKKKAILKLLILGAVLKAKIGTLLQILSFKLQVKFFIIALIGLGINLARFWVELKNKHNQQPQKVIYYEHAQHQHHYEHEEEPGWGPWSRSMEPEEPETEVTEIKNSPYRAYERNAQVYPTKPLLTLS